MAYNIIKGCLLRYIYYQIVDKKIADLSGDAYIKVHDLDPFKKLYSSLNTSKIILINNSQPFQNENDSKGLFRFNIIDEITKKTYKSNIALVKPTTTRELWFRVTDFSHYKNLNPGDIIRYSISYNENEDEFKIFISKILRFNVLLERKEENKYFMPKQAKTEIDQLSIEILKKFSIEKTTETTTRGKNSIDYIVFQTVENINKKYMGINKQFNSIEYFDTFEEIIYE